MSGKDAEKHRKESHARPAVPKGSPKAYSDAAKKMPGDQQGVRATPDTAPDNPPKS